MRDGFVSECVALSIPLAVLALIEYQSMPLCFIDLGITMTMISSKRT